MTDHTNDAAASVTDQATAWLIRLRDPACTRQERKQFEAWLSADEVHSREYQSLLEIWAASSELQPSFAVPDAPRASTRRIRFPRFNTLAALLSILLLVSLLAWYAGWLPSSYSRYTSEAQTQQITLPDGSEVQLGTDTSFAFLRFRDRREISFGHGEALFSARDDASAPLEVVIGGGRITATEVQFNVWYDEDRAVVTSIKGSLRLQGDVPHADPAVVQVSAGQQARFSRAAPVPEVSSANLERTLAWRQGKLILSNTPLADALPQINRYLRKPLRLGDDATARVRIGGIFSTSDMEGLVRSLPRIAPVRVISDGDGNPVIYSAPRRTL